jgi:hypothetical protein
MNWNETWDWTWLLPFHETQQLGFPRQAKASAEITWYTKMKVKMKNVTNDQLEDRNREPKMEFWSWKKNGKGVENTLPRSTAAAKHKKERTTHSML